MEDAGNSSGRDFLRQFVYLKLKNKKQCDLSKIIQNWDQKLNLAPPSLTCPFSSVDSFTKYHDPGVTVFMIETFTV